MAALSESTERAGTNLPCTGRLSMITGIPASCALCTEATMAAPSFGAQMMAFTFWAIRFSICWFCLAASPSAMTTTRLTPMALALATMASWFATQKADSSESMEMPTLTLPAPNASAGTNARLARASLRMLRKCFIEMPSGLDW